MPNHITRHSITNNAKNAMAPFGTNFSSGVWSIYLNLLGKNIARQFGKR